RGPTARPALEAAAKSPSPGFSFEPFTQRQDKTALGISGPSVWRSAVGRGYSVYAALLHFINSTLSLVPNS
ncbi:hypothetical protein, partial [Bradyrhizobium altum]|uniref:hypothetical protein n=1 Tax=Bradyrhizobium altum TaxID=1571202 RepID=UPI001E4D0EFB